MISYIFTLFTLYSKHGGKVRTYKLTTSRIGNARCIPFLDRYTLNGEIFISDLYVFYDDIIARCDEIRTGNYALRLFIISLFISGVPIFYHHRNTL